MDTFLDILANVIYGLMAVCAVGGVIFCLLLWRRTGSKNFWRKSDADLFLDDVGAELDKHNYDGVAEICDTPKYWNKAVAQLVLVAVQNREMGPPKVKRLVAERFEREILADLEYQTTWINTIVKSAPMLGLLGTVSGMIKAFAKIATMQETGSDPSVLANDISFALFTTALGLSIAIPLVFGGNVIHIRMSKLQDSVSEQLGYFFEDFERALGGKKR